MSTELRDFIEGQRRKLKRGYHGKLHKQTVDKLCDLALKAITTDLAVAGFLEATALSADKLRRHESAVEDVMHAATAQGPSPEALQRAGLCRHCKHAVAEHTNGGTCISCGVNCALEGTI